MVSKLIDNSKARDSREETFQFNVQDILGSQYQPKFCVSAEVTSKPYDGENKHLHIAQHFQEVRNIFPSKNWDQVTFRMFFAFVLHRNLENFDPKDQFTGSDNKRKYTYQRMDGRCTILLRRFIQKLKILRVFESYGISLD